MWRVRKSPSCTEPFFISFSYSVSSFFFGFSAFTESTATAVVSVLTVSAGMESFLNVLACRPMAVIRQPIIISVLFMSV